MGLLTPKMVAAASAEAEKKRRRPDVARATTLEDFQKIAQERGYSPAWANIQLRIRKGKEEKKALELEQRALVQPDLLQAPDFELEADLLSSHPKFNFDKDWEF